MADIVWEAVKGSSQIAEIGHDGNSTMGVKYIYGGEYHYSYVPKALFEKIKTAKSVGGALHVEVKAKPKEYPYRRV